MKLRYKVLSLILSLFVAVFATSTVFAWFNLQTYELDILGASAGAYFAYGDGTDKKLKNDGSREEWVEGVDSPDTWDRTTGPFGINVAMHMFNLAWLQNTGRFEDRTYYFELESNVQMYSPETGRNVVLPPIGNAEYPFNGVFNGNGKIISDLVVSTNKNVLYGNPAGASYEFSNAVGLFGMTGEDSIIENFIMAFPTVEVANDGENGASTLYDGKESMTEYATVGLAVGYVAGTVHSIGVMGGNIAVRRPQYTTFNSILGNLSDEAKNDNNLTGNPALGPGGGEGSGGSGSAFGSSFDVDTLYERLKQIARNQYELDETKKKVSDQYQSDKPAEDVSPFLPTLRHTETYWLLESGEKIPFTVTSESTYEGSTAREAISNQNIGYSIGNQNKFDQKTLTFTDKLTNPGNTTDNWYVLDGTEQKTPEQLKKTPRWFYTFNMPIRLFQSAYSTGAGFDEMSQEKYEQLPQGIKDLLLDDPTTPGKNSLMTIRLQNAYYLGDKAGVKTPIVHNNAANDKWTYFGEVSWMGNTYGDGHNVGGYAANSQGDFYDVGGNLMDENNYIFKYNEDGSKNYAAALDWATVTEDGYLYDQWNGTIFLDGPDGDLFNVFDDYTYRDGKFYHKDGTLVRIYCYNEGWGSGWYEDAAPVIGTPVKYNEYENGIYVPNNTIWFKPAQAGTFKFVMYTDTADYTFELIKITRTQATPENPFYSEKDSSDIEAEILIAQMLPPYVLLYYEVECSEEDIKAGNVEYFLAAYNGNGAYFAYFDIGASAQDDEDDTIKSDRADTTKRVTAVDFIYENVYIAQGDLTDSDGKPIPKGSFIVNETTLYIETGTMIRFGGSGAIVSFYYRKKEQSGTGFTIDAAYNSPTNSLTSTVTSKADIGTTEKTVDVNGNLNPSASAWIPS